ncbi:MULTISPECIES: HAD-IA family hydrolase [Demequina]|uniref:HAD-IA family hydrolase n=1 Tax=Demequina TaxID=577469 RepID=UPI0007860A78|nr:MULTISPECIES: HAD-IA family hydrolase [Demequina]
MNAPRGVIFGVDEVLIHTDDLHYQAWFSIADRLGVPFARQQHESLRGLTRDDGLNRILGLGATQVSRTEKELLSDDLDGIYRDLIRGLSPAHVTPGVAETLATLRDRGMRLAAASVSRNTRVMLERTGLRDRFDAVSDGENIVHAEPDPEMYLRAADFLALRPGDCAVVVGTRDGVEAARRGGFASFGLGAAAGHPDVTHPLSDLTDMLHSFVG